jgi:hypothetical protein
MVEVLTEHLVEVPGAEDQHAIETLTADCANDPFADGVGPRCPYRGPDDFDALGAEKTSKLVVKMLSRSWIKNREPAKRGDSSRARWVTHALVGWAVIPPRWTRRVACLMKINTYSRRRKTVSTVNKSHATIPLACVARNCDHVGPDRRGDGSTPALFRISHTVEGAS